MVVRVLAWASLEDRHREKILSRSEQDISAVEPRVQEIIDRAPCPDTYSAPVTDEEWFFRMPFKQLDLLLYAWENAIDIPEVSRIMELSEQQVKRAFRDFSSKHKTTEHLRHFPPSLA